MRASRSAMVICKFHEVWPPRYMNRQIIFPSSESRFAQELFTTEDNDQTHCLSGTYLAFIDQPLFSFHKHVMTINFIEGWNFWWRMLCFGVFYSDCRNHDEGILLIGQCTIVLLSLSKSCTILAQELKWCSKTVRKISRVELTHPQNNFLRWVNQFCKKGGFNEDKKILHTRNTQQLGKSDLINLWLEEWAIQLMNWGMLKSLRVPVIFRWLLPQKAVVLWQKKNVFDI